MDSLVPGRARPAGSLPVAALLGLDAVAFAVVSAIHFGVPLGPLTDPFPGARIPEAIIGAILAAAAVYTLAAGPARRWIALAATVISLLGVGFGLTVTIPGALYGDIAYHLAALVLLLVTAIVVLRARFTERS
ncbi:MAG: hypothetical protein ACREQM_15270 [Candidatus Dormibacteraceae bacterium]